MRDLTYDEFLSLQPELDDDNALKRYDKPPTGTYDKFHIWTEVDSDTDQNTLILAGIHSVNRVSYVITKVAWTDPNARVFVHANEELEEMYADQ